MQYSKYEKSARLHTVCSYQIKLSLIVLIIIGIDAYLNGYLQVLLVAVRDKHFDLSQTIIFIISRNVIIKIIYSAAMS